MMASAISRKTGLREGRVYWPEWKERWNAATDQDTCIGLLHNGFRVEVASAEQESERIKCYLSVADGHCSRSLSGDEFMQASKAFDILANLDHSHDFFDQRLRILPPSTIEAILHFFRPKVEEEGGGFVNLYVPEGDKGHHTMRKMNESLLRWCRRVWNRDITYKSEYSSLPGPWPENHEAYLLLEKIRPQVLEILYAYGHGQLEKLTDQVFAPGLVDKKKPTNRVQWELFTPDCTSQLEQLASRNSRLVGGHTIGEAVSAALIAGSSAAKVVTLVWDAQKWLALKNKKR